MLLRIRERPMPDLAVEREMHELRARIDGKETTLGAQLTLGISAKMKVKMMLETKEKKLQSRMLQMNTYSRLLQG